MGALFSQYYPPKPRWTAKDIPDLTGKIALVTGANTGIGKETAKELLAHGAKVYIAARSKSKAEAAIADLKAATGKEALFLELDLSDLVAVKRSAETFLTLESTLNILVASAGIQSPPVEQLSPQGIDLQLATNVVGHWFFIQQLLPALRAGVAAGGARVPIVASLGADQAPPLNWEAFTELNARKKMGPMMLYAQSKLLDVVLAKELARRYADSGIIFSALNPGNISTELYRWAGKTLHTILSTLFLYPLVPYGALTSLYAATAPEANTNGAYYIPWARLGTTPKQAQDSAVGARLWEWMEKQAGKLEA